VIPSVIASKTWSCESVHSSQLVMVRVKRAVAHSRVQPCLQVYKPIDNTSAQMGRNQDTPFLPPGPEAFTES
jgi:hypothetical protein